MLLSLSDPPTSTFPSFSLPFPWSPLPPLPWPLCNLHIFIIIKSLSFLFWIVNKAYMNREAFAGPMRWIWYKHSFILWLLFERQKPQLINKFLSLCNRCYTSSPCVPLCCSVVPTWLLKTSVSHIVSLVTFSIMTLNKHCIFSHLIPHHCAVTDTHCCTQNMALTFTGEVHILKNSWNETTTNVKCECNY